MENEFLPLTKQFSKIEGLQAPYSIVYMLEAAGADECRLTLCRTGKAQCVESVRLTAAPEYGYRLLQFLSENAVQPEIWLDVLAEIGQSFVPCNEKGGEVCE